MQPDSDEVAGNHQDLLQDVAHMFLEKGRRIGDGVLCHLCPERLGRVRDHLRAIATQHATCPLPPKLPGPSCMILSTMHRGHQDKKLNNEDVSYAALIGGTCSTGLAPILLLKQRMLQALLNCGKHGLAVTTCK